ncbi:hypothetical protein ACTWPT_46005 [Nonomuraea sp. 3N208]|uniref:hypothetical protein n=1 Tax=Nonomuraea sp. 3N208 TaxID=3457421 RepID=UPI003FD673E4
MGALPWMYRYLKDDGVGTFGVDEVLIHGWTGDGQVLAVQPGWRPERREAMLAPASRFCAERYTVDV